MMGRWIANTVLATGVAGVVGVASAGALPRLRVHAEGRFLQTDDGRPFFWLGDTAWELFHRLNREEAIHYLETRARQEFNVVQAVALAELDGLRVPNAYGHVPFEGLDPTRPAERPGPDNDYWDHVDFIVRAANERGIYIGFLPTWGDKWTSAAGGAGPVIFHPTNALAYGRWLGRRYREAGLVWILGGDRTVDTPEHRAIIAAMANGLREGDGGAHLITFHPRGGRSSSEWFHTADWLDFNMRQNGHDAVWPAYARTALDYHRRPVKPVLDGEPIYEGHPVGFRANEHGVSLAADVRRALYWNLCAGAFGHTYGHHSVWQMWSAGRRPINAPILEWREAIHEPGADQMRHARRLFESRPFFTRIPDDSLIEPHPHNTNAVPGAGLRRLAATRDRDGRWAMVYVPCARPFRVNPAPLRNGRWVAWWYDPRTGEAARIGEFDRSALPVFTPPTPGEMLDWVLVLDEAAQGWPPPGRSR